MSINNKQPENQIRLVSVVNSRVAENNIIFCMCAEPASEEQMQFFKEYQLLVAKSSDLKIKTGERVPIYSRTKNHKWYLTKDKYAVLYLLFVNIKVDEEVVFKLQGKLQVIADRYYEDIQENNETTLKPMKELMTFHVNQFNFAIIYNPQADIFMQSEESNKEIVEIEGVDVNFDKKGKVSTTTDSSNIFVIIDKRQGRVFSWMSS